MDELDLARELADVADEIAMRYFSRDPEVTTKPDGTLVTVADKEIEATLRRRIKEFFPEHGILGEEQGLEGEEGAPIWVLDPIDGTNNYVWGIPVFATLIGLRVEGKTTVAVVSAPALGERYEAARGDGARMNGSPIQVTSVSSIEDARVCYGSWSDFDKADIVERWLDVLRRCKRARGFGDFWGHMLVARGAAEVMVEPILAPWDVFPLEVIVEEAGGRTSHFDGTPFQGLGNCLTTNGVLHDQFVTTLSEGR